MYQNREYASSENMLYRTSSTAITERFNTLFQIKTVLFFELYQKFAIFQAPSVVLHLRNNERTTAVDEIKNW